MREKFTSGLVVAALVMTAGIAVAQETTVEVKRGKVLAVHGNELIFRGPEGVKSVHVPDDFRFDMDGKQLSIHQLKPGMRLSAVITTTTRPVEMTTTEVRSGEVVHTQGGAVILRKDNGELVKFTTKTIKESGAVVTKDGKPIDLTTLRAGSRLTATFVTKQPPTMVTEQELKVFAANPPPPAPRPKPKPARVAQVREPQPKTLPKTAGPLPLVGLGGLAMLAIGLGLTAARRVRRLKAQS